MRRCPIPGPGRRPPPSRSVRVLRWIGCFPAAFLGGGLAGGLVDLMNRTAIVDYQDPRALWVGLYISCLPGLAAGAAGVFLASYTAPGGRKPVALIIAGTPFLVGFFPSLLFWSAPSLPSVCSLLSVFVGSAGMAYTILLEEILPERSIRSA